MGAPPDGVAEWQLAQSLASTWATSHGIPVKADADGCVPSTAVVGTAVLTDRFGWAVSTPV